VTICVSANDRSTTYGGRKRGGGGGGNYRRLRGKRIWRPPESERGPKRGTYHHTSPNLVRPFFLMGRREEYAIKRKVERGPVGVSNGGEKKKGPSSGRDILDGSLVSRSRAKVRFKKETGARKRTERLPLNGGG